MVKQQKKKERSLLLQIFVGVFFSIVILTFVGVCFVIFLAYTEEPLEEEKELTKGQLLSINQSKYYYNSNILFYKYANYKHENPSSEKYECTDEDKKRMQDAFSIIENRTVLRFMEVSGRAHIYIYCGDLITDPIAGETLGEAEIQLSSYGGFEIEYSTIYLYENIEHKCEDFPHTEMHELLHALGYDHSDEPDEVMYYRYWTCNANIIPDWIFEDLNLRYSNI